MNNGVHPAKNLPPPVPSRMGEDPEESSKPHELKTRRGCVRLYELVGTEVLPYVSRAASALKVAQMRQAELLRLLIPAVKPSHTESLH